MPNAFAHVELNTPELAQAKKFYSSVFSWKLEDMPGIGYTMINVGKGTAGGMQQKPMPEQPTAWLPYVEVADVRGTLDKARTAGANVVVDYTPIGEMGAIGVFVDPAGASLGVWEATRKVSATSTRKTAAKKKKPAKKAAAKKPAKKAGKKKR